MKLLDKTLPTLVEKKIEKNNNFMLQRSFITQYFFRSGCCQKGDTNTEGISKFSGKEKGRT